VEQAVFGDVGSLGLPSMHQDSATKHCIVTNHDNCLNPLFMSRDDHDVNIKGAMSDQTRVSLWTTMKTTVNRSRR